VIRIKDLKLRQRIFDDLAAIDLDEVRKYVTLSDEQFKCFCTVEGISEQIDGHLESKNQRGLLFWILMPGIITRGSADFDFIF